MTVALTAGALSASAAHAGTGLCPAAYPTSLGVETSDPNEAPYLDDILACRSSDGAVLVRNNSDVVWAFQGGGGGLIYKVEQPAAGALFAAAAQKVYRYAYMAPGEAVRLPLGQVDMQWTIHPELSFMWFGQTKLTDRVKSQAKTTIADILSNTKAKKAVVDCTLAAWESSADVGGVVFGDADAVSIWKAAFGVGASAGTCERSWKAAEKSTGRFRFPTYVDTVIAVGDDARVARQVIATADDLGRYGKQFSSIVCALPKMPC